MQYYLTLEHLFWIVITVRVLWLGAAAWEYLKADSLQIRRDTIQFPCLIALHYSALSSIEWVAKNFPSALSRENVKSNKNLFPEIKQLQEDVWTWNISWYTAALRCSRFDWEHEHLVTTFKGITTTSHSLWIHLKNAVASIQLPTFQPCLTLLITPKLGSQS